MFKAAVGTNAVSLENNVIVLLNEFFIIYFLFVIVFDCSADSA